MKHGDGVSRVADDRRGARAAKKFNDTLRSHVLACFGELMSSPEFYKPRCLIGVPFEY